MPKTVDIEGVGPVQGEKLRRAGVRSTTALLNRGGNPKGRKEVAATTNIAETKLPEWVKQAKTLPGAFAYQTRWSQDH